MSLLSVCHHSLLYPSLLGLLLIFQNSKWKRPWLSIKKSWVKESFFPSLTFPRQGGQLSWNPHAHHSSLGVSLTSFLGSKDCSRVRQGCMLPLENFTLQEFSFPHNIMLWFLPFDSTPSQVYSAVHEKLIHVQFILNTHRWYGVRRKEHATGYRSFICTNSTADAITQ